jgi:RHS repeat-associated protein
LPCRTFVAAQPTGTEIPVTVTTYDMYGQVRTVVGKEQHRNAAYHHDRERRGWPPKRCHRLAGRRDRERHIVYDQATGRATTTQTLDGAGAVTATITRSYDTLGLQTSYTDADGNTSTTTYDLLSRPATINDGRGTQSLNYNGGGEKRGLATQVVDSQAGTFTTTYNSRGAIATETGPDGVTVNHHYDELGQATGLEYLTSCDAGTCTLYYDYEDFDIHGRSRSDSSSFSNSGDGYDSAGRLTGVRQETAQGCALREYTFDRSTNRTQMKSYGPDANGDCQENTPTSDRTWVYDTADRVTAPSHTIDALGRTVTVSGTDLTAGTGTGDVQLTYYANDMVRTMTNGTADATYTLDVMPNRHRAYSVTCGGVTATHVHHYSDETDKPSWTAESGSYTWRINGPGGLSAFYKGANSTVEWQIANLHGDIDAVRIGGSVGLAYTSVTDEYGQSVSGTSPRYGYLGTEQRSADNPSGLTTMGARHYNPETGRFLSTGGAGTGAGDRVRAYSLVTSSTSTARGCPRGGGRSSPP